MACINSDGTLTAISRRVLTVLAAPHTAAELAAATGMPLYRVRATLRETGRARLVKAVGGSDDGAYQLTALGRDALDLDAA